MKYSSLRFADMLHGPGPRVTIFISGDNEDGTEFTEDTLIDIVHELNNEHYVGFTFFGHPLDECNRNRVRDVARTLKAVFGDEITVCLYSGTTLKDIQSMEDPVVSEMLDYIDLICESENSRFFEVHHYINDNEFAEVHYI